VRTPLKWPVGEANSHGLPRPTWLTQWIILVAATGRDLRRRPARTAGTSRRGRPDLGHRLDLDEQVRPHELLHDDHGAGRGIVLEVLRTDLIQRLVSRPSKATVVADVCRERASDLSRAFRVVLPG